jgi:hypothetical protein
MYLTIVSGFISQGFSQLGPDRFPDILLHHGHHRLSHQQKSNLSRSKICYTEFTMKTTQLM